MLRDRFRLMRRRVYLLKRMRIIDNVDKKTSVFNNGTTKKCSKIIITIITFQTLPRIRLIV